MNEPLRTEYMEIDYSNLRDRIVVIGTPSYQSVVHVQYVQSLINTLMQAQLFGIKPYWSQYGNIANVPKMRNLVLAEALAIGADDVVFIDSDVGWHPQDFYRMLVHDADVVGVPPRKNNNAREFATNPYPYSKIKVDRGLMAVREVATAFLRVSGHAIRTMRDLWPGLQYFDPDICGGMENLYNFCPYLQHVDWDGTRRLKGEDYGLMELLRAAGFPIYIDVDITITHHKEVPLHGKFLDEIVQQLPPTRDSIQPTAA